MSDSISIDYEIPTEFKDNEWWLKEWNRLHIASIRVSNEFKADYCEEVIKKAKDLYYNSGETIITDGRYDAFEMYLRRLRPDSKLLEQVGSEK